MVRGGVGLRMLGRAQQLITEFYLQPNLRGMIS